MCPPRKLKGSKKIFMRERNVANETTYNRPNSKPSFTWRDENGGKVIFIYPTQQIVWSTPR